MCDGIVDVVRAVKITVNNHTTAWYEPVFVCVEHVQ